MTSIKAHEVRNILHEDVYYPAHAPRDESPEYKAIHHQLVVVEDRPCFICQKRNSDGAQMETHHLWVEWALANAVDPAKVHAFLHDPTILQDPAGWVDHNRHNLLVLCADHHRHRETGIHALSFPIWVAQKFLKDGTQLTDSSPTQGNEP